MYDIYKVCGIVIITVVLTVVLKSQGSLIAKFLPQICMVAIVGSVFLAIKPVLEFLKNITNTSGENKSSITTLFAASAIAIICNVIEGVCKENGEALLANAVVLAGNVQIILLALPIIKGLFDEVTRII